MGSCLGEQRVYFAPGGEQLALRHLPSSKSRLRLLEWHDCCALTALARCEPSFPLCSRTSEHLSNLESAVPSVKEVQTPSQPKGKGGSVERVVGPHTLSTLHYCYCVTLIHSPIRPHLLIPPPPIPLPRSTTPTYYPSQPTRPPHPAPASLKWECYSCSDHAKTSVGHCRAVSQHLRVSLCILRLCSDFHEIAQKFKALQSPHPKPSLQDGQLGATPAGIVVLCTFK